MWHLCIFIFILFFSSGAQFFSSRASNYNELEEGGCELAGATGWLDPAPGVGSKTLKRTSGGMGSSFEDALAKWCERVGTGMPNGLHERILDRCGGGGATSPGGWMGERRGRYYSAWGAEMWSVLRPPTCRGVGYGAPRARSPTMDRRTRLSGEAMGGGLGRNHGPGGGGEHCEG